MNATYRSNRPALIAAIATIVAMAFAASASATQITPASKVMHFWNKEGTKVNFLPGNAYFPAFIQCGEVKLSGTTPSETKNEFGGLYTGVSNTNRAGVGTYSSGSGSVTFDLSLSKIGTCGVYLEAGAGPEFIGAANPTSVSSGWSFTGSAVEQGGQTVEVGAIGMPKEGIQFATPTQANCNAILSPARSAVLAGTYDSETLSLRLDGQIDGKATGCEPSPLGKEFEFGINSTWQVEGDFIVFPIGGTRLKINP